MCWSFAVSIVVHRTGLKKVGLKLFIGLKMDKSGSDALVA